jgi:hypothetical protein
MKGKKKILERGQGNGGGGNIFQTIIEFVIFFPNFSNNAKFSTTKKTTIYHTSNGIIFNIKDISEFFGDHMPFIGIYI